MASIMAQESDSSKGIAGRSFEGHKLTTTFHTNFLLGHHYRPFYIYLFLHYLYGSYVGDLFGVKSAQSIQGSAFWDRIWKLVRSVSVIHRY